MKRCVPMSDVERLSAAHILWLAGRWSRFAAVSDQHLPQPVTAGGILVRWSDETLAALFRGWGEIQPSPSGGWVLEDEFGSRPCAAAGQISAAFAADDTLRERVLYLLLHAAQQETRAAQREVAVAATEGARVRALARRDRAERWERFVFRRTREWVRQNFVYRNR